MSAPPTKLEKLIAKATVEVRRVSDRLKLAEASNLKEAIRPLTKQFHEASQKKEELAILLKPSEEPLKRLLEHAADKRTFADKLEPRSPAKANVLRRGAKAIENRYLLWCDHHGKTPQLLEVYRPKVKEPAKKEPEPVATQSGRGGRRDGAGRPALGHVQLLFKCSPTTAVKARKLAKARNLTLGGWLDSVIASLQ